MDTDDRSVVEFTKVSREFSCSPFCERGRSFKVDDYFFGFERMMGWCGNQKVIEVHGVAIIVNREE
jgi:hypothetical protein